MSYEEICEAIRRERKCKELTLKQLADLVHCSEQAISQYERGVRPLSTKMLCKIAEALDASVFMVTNWKEAHP